MWARIKEWPRRCSNTPEPGPQKGWHATVDTRESSAPHAHSPTQDHDDTVEAHYSGLERLRPHACTDGLVFLTYTVFDEAVGEEVERLEVVPSPYLSFSLTRRVASTSVASTAA